MRMSNEEINNILYTPDIKELMKKDYSSEVLQSCKKSVMFGSGDFVKEVGSSWFKVLRVDGRNVYLDYDDGLNCLDINDISEWKH